MAKLWITAILLVATSLTLPACNPTTVPTTTPNLAIMAESSVVEAGSSFIVSGTSFQPKQWVFADFKYQATNRNESVNALGKADEQGSIYLRIQVPEDTTPGKYEVKISTGSSERIEDRQLLTTILVQVKTNPSDPVEIIMVFKAQPGAPPPTGPFGSIETNPHPDQIQRVFSPGDKMFILLRISNKIKTNVTFSKFVYFNKGTGKEMDVGSSSDLMQAWEPGQINLLAYKNPWLVPSEAGDYQLRIYLDNKVVASALFQVK